MRCLPRLSRIEAAMKPMGREIATDTSDTVTPVRMAEVMADWANTWWKLWSVNLLGWIWLLQNLDSATVTSARMGSTVATKA